MINGYKAVHLFFIRDRFIRDEMMSTENFQKIRDQYSTFFYLKGWQWGRNKGCVSKKGPTTAKNKG